MQAAYQHFDVWAEFAEGGAGIICTGNIPIDRDYLERQGNAVLDRRNAWDAVEAFPSLHCCCQIERSYVPCAIAASW